MRSLCSFIDGVALQPLARAVFLTLMLGTVPSAAHATHGDKFDIVSLEMQDAGHTVWRISSPNVVQKTTTYPSIAVVAGDSVQLFAGGCVQTGGHGFTWKRYVNPSGPKSDHYYHGMVGIPGMTTGLERVQQFGLDTPHPVTASGPLTLGYEDDNYGDNGYWGHDNGTGDQCKNVSNAFVIVAITHSGGTPIVASSFQDVAPDAFTQRAGWAFENEPTPELSWTTFKNAFDFHWYDYIDPATYIVFAATRGNLASDGDCMGMSLLADMAENQWVVGPISEDVWKNYHFTTWNSAPPFVLNAIRTAHWEQLSVAFIHNYLANVVRSPAENAQIIASDLNKPNFTYGLISIAHGKGGHILVPLKVRSGTQNGKSVTLIDVYDSNRPYPAQTASIVVDGSNWSFPMAGGDTWSGSTANDGLAYVPYDGSSGWRRFAANFAGLIQVMFGSADVQQVTDSHGRKLFRPDGSIDTSPTGLGTAVFRIPYYGQATRNGQPALSLTSNVLEPSSNARTVARLEQEYGAEYAQASNVFMIDPNKVADLTFQTGARSSGKPVRMLVHQNNEFFEIRATNLAAAGQPLGLTIHQTTALGAGGITVKSLDGRPALATVTNGINSGGTINLQRTDPMPIGAGVRIRNISNNLRLSSPAAITSIHVTPQILDQAGVRDLQAHAASIEPTN
jgi:hypothetical protein